MTEVKEVVRVTLDNGEHYQALDENIENVVGVCQYHSHLEVVGGWVSTKHVAAIVRRWS